MRRLGGFREQILDLENIYQAWRQARRGKRDRAEVARFALNLEPELLSIQSDLRSGTYRPGAYRSFTIYERKKRIIHAAKFRDRVVQHALMNLIEPPMDRRFIHDTYACRKRKGVHRAVERYQAWSGRYTYVLKMDIRSYFASIRHEILQAQLAARLKDAFVLDCLGRILRFGPADDQASNGARRGIPIGNLTSQFFANLYLDDFDHWMKQSEMQPAYLRYVDDLFVLGDDKVALHRLLNRVREQLGNLRLELKPESVQIGRASEKTNVLGYQVAPDRRWLRNDNGYRFQRRFHAQQKAVSAGRMALDDVRSSLCAWIGHARHGETQGLRETIIPNVRFAGSAQVLGNRP